MSHHLLDDDPRIDIRSICINENKVTLQDMTKVLVAKGERIGMRILAIGPLREITCIAAPGFRINGSSEEFIPGDFLKTKETCRKIYLKRFISPGHRRGRRFLAEEKEKNENKEGEKKEENDPCHIYLEMK